MKVAVGYKNEHQVQVLAILSVSMTCIGYGMHYSWTSPSIPELISDKSRNISIDDASYLVIFQALAMGISAPLFPLLIDKIGRKLVILLIAVPQIIGWIIIAFASNIWLLYLAKCFVGIADSAIYTAIFVYVCEISVPSVRHGWTNVTVITMYVGIFMVNIIGTQIGVRSTALICLACSSMHLAVFSWAPESPYYLLMKNKPESARKALQTLRMRSDVEKELLSLTADVTRQQSEPGSWKDLLCTSSNRKALVITVGLRILQQLSGITVFEVYAQYMFQQAGVTLSASTSAIIFTGLWLICVSLCLFTVNKFGRRPLLIYSSLGCGISLMAEAIFFAIKEFTTIDVTQLYWFPLTGMIVYVIFSSGGLATIPSAMAGELYSTKIKSKAMIINNIVFAICILVLSKVFQSLTEMFGIYAPFLLFAFSSLVGVGFIYFCVIETKGKTLEDIQQELIGN